MNTGEGGSEREVAEDEVLAQHKRIVEIGEGKRQMDWSDWAMSISESKCLTPEGQRVALWAAEILQRTLGDDFFQRVDDWFTRMRAKNPDLTPDSHPVFSFGFWPVNDLPWVYANLMWWAAHVQLFQHDTMSRSQLHLAPNRIGRVLKSLRANLEPINWTTSLLQLEVAGLGLKAGWQILFEPALANKLGNKRYADVGLTNGQIQLLVETTVMRLSETERKILARSRRASWQMFNLGLQYGVQISGSLGSFVRQSAEEEALWLQEVEETSRATAEDGQSRQVRGPEGGLFTISRTTEATTDEPWGVTGDLVETRILDRLGAVLKAKNDQAEGSVTPVWGRLQETAGLWQSTRFQGITLAQLLEFLIGFLHKIFPSFPNIAGVLLSPGVLWAGNAPPSSLVDRVELDGGIALRSPVSRHWAREMIIVPQAGTPVTDTKMLVDWYASEGTWLNWALEQLQYPPFEALVYEPSA